MPVPALSLGDQLGELLAQVPELAARVERLERENARLHEEVAGLRERTLDPLEDLVTPRQVVAGGTVTMGQIRDHLKFRDTNGLSRYVSKRGRRLRISRKGYAEWLQQRRA